jgi:hypothetical protein
VAVDLNKILQTGSDFKLEREDSIQIYTKQDLEEVQYITIDGHVRTPGKIAFREGMQIQDVIAMSGGFNYDAAYHRVELSRIKKNRTDSLANQLVDLIKLELDSNLSSRDNSFVLQAQDYIFVPRLLNSVFLLSREVPILAPLRRRHSLLCLLLRTAVKWALHPI